MIAHDDDGTTSARQRGPQTKLCTCGMTISAKKPWCSTCSAARRRMYNNAISRATRRAARSAVCAISPGL
jgi:CDGSH-type Zn-finger protein